MYSMMSKDSIVARFKIYPDITLYRPRKSIKSPQDAGSSFRDPNKTLIQFKSEFCPYTPSLGIWMEETSGNASPCVPEMSFGNSIAILTNLTLSLISSVSPCKYWIVPQI